MTALIYFLLGTIIMVAIYLYYKQNRGRKNVRKNLTKL